MSKEQFLQDLEDSEYVQIEGHAVNANGNAEIHVNFIDTAGYEITEFICDIADKYNFRVKGLSFEGGITFINDEKTTLRDRLSI